MLKNKIPLCAFIGVNVFVLGIFFIGVGCMIASEGRMDEFELILLAFAILLFGGCLLISGIGLMTRKNWARIFINIILMLLFIGLGVISYFFVQEMLTRTYYRRQIPAQLSLLLFGFLILFGIFLFINNTRVMDELKQKKKEEI